MAMEATLKEQPADPVGYLADFMLKQHASTAQKGTQQSEADAAQLAASRLDLKRREALRRAFDHFDRDSNGVLSFKEIQAALKTLGLRVDREFFRRFRLADSNKDRRLQQA